MAFAALKIYMRIACIERVVLIVATCLPISCAAQATVVKIPWKPAFARLNVVVRPGWRVEFHCHHDDQELTCAISHLAYGKEERYPELLIDPQNLRGEKWQPGQWWFHSSYNLCEGNGKFNVYVGNGSLHCAKKQRGWRANHFPLRGDHQMTIHVA